MGEIRSGHASSRLHKSNLLTLHDNSIQDKNGLLDKNECRLLVDEPKERNPLYCFADSERFWLPVSSAIIPPSLCQFRHHCAKLYSYPFKCVDDLAYAQVQLDLLLQSCVPSLCYNESH